MKDVFLYKCLEILKKPEVKHEIKEFMRPIIELITQEIYPYLYLSLIFTAYVLISCCDKKPSKLDSILGDMSYIVYLLHTTIGYFLLISAPNILPKSFNFFALSFIFTCAISYFLVKYYEGPLQRMLKSMKWAKIKY